MATLLFNDLQKVYPNKVQAVFDFNLEIKDKEFIVFVGPSGCGKSTTLRMIAGLEDISGGELYIDGKLVNYVDPKDRDIAMVFQSYALYPQMTVFENISFGLSIRKLDMPIYEHNPEINTLNKEIAALYRKLKRINRKIRKHQSDLDLKQEQLAVKNELFEKFNKIDSLHVQLTGISNYLIKKNQKAYIKSEAEIRKLTKRLNKLFRLDEDKVDKFEIENLIRQIEYSKTQSIFFENQCEYFKTNEVPLVKNRLLTRNELLKEVIHVSDILDLFTYLDRKPAQLSGGQRQRVALGRAIIRKPKVFLMDEPLSNLDAKLRTQTRSEIAKIHRDVGATTIYVTHDQVEAMTLADRIVIMKDGYIQQISTPEEAYEKPVNMFVAGFIGSPAMCFVNGIIRDKKFISFSDVNHFEIELPEDKIKLLKQYQNREIVFGVRPEDLHSSLDTVQFNKSKIVEFEYYDCELLGHEFIYYINVGDNKLLCKTANRINDKKFGIGNFNFDIDKIHFFDKETTLRIF